MSGARGLEAAAKAIADEFGLPFDPSPFSSESPYDRDYWMNLAEKAVAAYLAAQDPSAVSGARGLDPMRTFVEDVARLPLNPSLLEVDGLVGRARQLLAQDPSAEGQGKDVDALSRAVTDMWLAGGELYGALKSTGFESVEPVLARWREACEAYTRAEDRAKLDAALLAKNEIERERVRLLKASGAHRAPTGSQAEAGPESVTQIADELSRLPSEHVRKRDELVARLRSLVSTGSHAEPEG